MNTANTTPAAPSPEYLAALAALRGPGDGPGDRTFEPVPYIGGGCLSFEIERRARALRADRLTVRVLRGAGYRTDEKARARLRTFRERGRIEAREITLDEMMGGAAGAGARMTTAGELPTGTTAWLWAGSCWILGRAL